MGKQENLFDALYRRVASSFGLSTCEMWIYYFLLIAPGEVTQQTVSSQMMFPKQTVNSAVMKLAKKGMLKLESGSDNRKRKTICLTREGSDFAQKTVQRLLEAEFDAVKIFGSEKLIALSKLREEYFGILEDVFEKGFLSDK